MKNMYYCRSRDKYRSIIGNAAGNAFISSLEIIMGAQLCSSCEAEKRPINSRRKFKLLLCRVGEDVTKIRYFCIFRYFRYICI